VLIYKVGNYVEPLGFSPDGLYVMKFDWEGKSDEEVKAKLLTITETMKRIPGVKGIATTTDNTPFFNNNQAVEPVKYAGRFATAEKWYADDEFARVLKVPVAAGRWFNPADNAAKNNPLVINQQLREQVFGSENPVGKTILVGDRQHTVVGLVETYRNNTFKEPEPGFFVRNDLYNQADKPGRELLIRYDSDKAEFDDELFKYTSARFAGNALSIEGVTVRENIPVDIFRQYEISSFLVPVLVLLVVGGFLVFNVILGFFGSFWLTINYRKSEIGLRRAIGASSVQVYRQIISEGFTIATFGVLPAAVLALQVPILDVFPFVGASVYAAAFLVSAVLIYAFVYVCAIYPSSLAARMYPALALRDH
jgi:putative ABC transport system permease protein